MRVAYRKWGVEYLSAENYIIERIEELCEKKHMSRYRLAQKSGIAQSSISTLLNRKSVPTIQTLEKICDVETERNGLYKEDHKTLKIDGAKLKALNERCHKLLEETI